MPILKANIITIIFKRLKNFGAEHSLNFPLLIVIVFVTVLAYFNIYTGSSVSDTSHIEKIQNKIGWHYSDNVYDCEFRIYSANPVPAMLTQATSDLNFG